MRKFVLPFNMAALPSPLQVAGKATHKATHWITPPSPKRTDKPLSSPPLQAVAICTSCSLPSLTRNSRCSYCGSLLWPGVSWIKRLFSTRRLLIAGLLTLGGAGLVAQSQLTPPSNLFASIKAIQFPSSSLLSHWQAAKLPTLPATAALQPTLTTAQPARKPAAIVSMPPILLPLQETTKPTELHPSAASTIPLTCGGFPAAGQPEPDFGPYLTKVQNKIRTHWRPPAVDQPKHVVVLYRIACNGKLVHTRIKTSSGIPVADQAALSAIRSAAPFPALPASYTGQNVDVEFDFDYEMVSGQKPHPTLH